MKQECSSTCPLCKLNRRLARFLRAWANFIDRTPAQTSGEQS